MHGSDNYDCAYQLHQKISYSIHVLVQLSRHTHAHIQTRIKNITFSAAMCVCVCAGGGSDHDPTRSVNGTCPSVGKEFRMGVGQFVIHITLIIHRTITKSVVT